MAGRDAGSGKGPKNETPRCWRGAVLNGERVSKGKRKVKKNVVGTQVAGGAEAAVAGAEGIGEHEAR